MDAQKTHQKEFAEAVKENFRKSRMTMPVQSYHHQWFSKCGIQILGVCKTTFVFLLYHRRKNTVLISFILDKTYLSGIMVLK